eukprot:TRINITY_DN5098_c3_g1_i2.p1 TRINITY_DN5098_c3_g1~~TRINITY_DN5098_c3_g1_i2.p1  ORF type:complete len:323 (+),score=54.44 TRINITY_DN5098_c3_g1_i2:85-969(+)
MPKKRSLDGEFIVFTGKMAMLRAEATQKASAAGASVQGTVTGTTTLLVCAGGADNMNTTKYTKAISRGLEIWSEEDFIRVLNNGPRPGKNNHKKFKKVKNAPPPDSESDSTSDSSSSSDYHKKKKQKNKSSPTSSPSAKKPKPMREEDTSSIMFYCGKGGCKVKIAEQYKYHSKSEKVVTDTDNSARHINLAPYDISPPLNAVIEGNLDSPAWTILHALGINQKYHDSAVMEPLKPKTLGPTHPIWVKLSKAKGKDPFILKFKGKFAPTTSPVFFGAMRSDCIIGTLQGSGEDW